MFSKQKVNPDDIESDLDDEVEEPLSPSQLFKGVKAPVSPFAINKTSAFNLNQDVMTSKVKVNLFAFKKENVQQPLQILKQEETNQEKEEKN